MSISFARGGRKEERRKAERPECSDVEAIPRSCSRLGRFASGRRKGEGGKEEGDGDAKKESDFQYYGCQRLSRV